MSASLFHPTRSSPDDFTRLRTDRRKSVLLIPPTSTNQVSTTKWLCPNLGVERLASYLRHHGHRAETYDVNAFRAFGSGGRDRLTLEEKLAEREWDVIGFGVYEATMVVDIEHMLLAEKLCPSALLVAGGHAAQFDYQTLLDKSPTRVVVLGEGEKPLLALVEGRPLHEIPGIVVKNTGNVLDGEEFAQVTTGMDYEGIPFEIYWDYYVDLYRASGAEITPLISQQIHTIRVYTRNYCPMNCSFCSSTNWLRFAHGGGVPISDFQGKPLVDLLKRLVEAHPRVETVYFTDDEFCIIRSKLIETLNLLIEAQLPLSYICFTRIDDLDEEIIELMVRAGFRTLNVGVESFQEEVLREFNKKIGVARIDHTLDLLNEHGIRPSCTFILCSPRSKLEWVENVSRRILGEVQAGRLYAGVNVAVEPQRGASMNEVHTEFETQLMSIPGTRLKLKRHRFIKCEDPEVREFQYRFLARWAAFTEAHFEPGGHGGHLNTQVQSEIKLGVVLDVIEEIKAERGEPDRFRFSLMTEAERLALWESLEKYSYGVGI